MALMNSKWSPIIHSRALYLNCQVCYDRNNNFENKLWSLDLSRHAEDVFGELTNEAHQFNDRCRILGERIVNLNDRISLMSQNSSEHMEPYALRSREIKYDDQVCLNSQFHSQVA